jgi:hypothetical protein
MNLHGARKLADRLRPLITPYRGTSVVLRRRWWSGGEPGIGVAQNTDTELPSYVKVRQLTAREIAASGGRFREGAVEISSITPAYDTGTESGGLGEADLRTGGSKAVEVLFVLSGDVSGEFRLASLDSSNALNTKLVANRLRTTP